jgi:hypothetical protein
VGQRGESQTRNMDVVFQAAEITESFHGLNQVGSLKTSLLTKL